MTRAEERVDEGRDERNEEVKEEQVSGREEERKGRARSVLRVFVGPT